ncbi:MAG: LEA type 2 family protein [Cocleimonas sp.]
MELDDNLWFHVTMKLLKRIQKTTSAFSLFFLLFTLAGCSSAGIKGVVEPPSIQVHTVKMGNFNLSGGTATFVLNIKNPNKFPIPLAGFDYGLSLNGVAVARGTKEQRVTIRAGESQKVTVPLTLSFTNMMNMIPGLLRDKSLNYALDGSVHLPWFNIPFQRSGSANLR